MESLVNGTATREERMMVGGIVGLFLCFFAVWVGIGLVLMKHMWFLILMPVLPGLFVYYNLCDDWKAYRRAKKAARLGTEGQQPARQSVAANVEEHRNRR